MLTETDCAGPWTHLEKDITECHRMITENTGHSADWWRARLSGLQHAVEVLDHYEAKP